MLNRELAANARNKLTEAVALHGAQAYQVTKLSTKLYALRHDSSHGLIAEVETYVNGLTATPKEYSRAFAEYKVELRTFDGVVNDVDAKLHDATVKGSAGTGAGVAAGAATALLGPTAAMAIATTFGTASTGTAIATLSGAAATNAALAWLGGGALVAGGGGMSAGGALLALAGPVGWGLAGLAAAGGAAYVAQANKKTAEEANEKRLPIEAEIRSLKHAAVEITKLLDLTTQHTDGMKSLLKSLKHDAPRDYRKFSSQQKSQIGALVNHVQTLSHLLNKKIS
jgi:hypothetical protein